MTSMPASNSGWTTASAPAFLRRVGGAGHDVETWIEVSGVAHRELHSRPMRHQGRHQPSFGEPDMREHCDVAGVAVDGRHSCLTQLIYHPGVVLHDEVREVPTMQGVCKLTPDAAATADHGVPAQSCRLRGSTGA